jgi:hypothetical protein
MALYYAEGKKQLLKWSKRLELNQVHERSEKGR